MPCKDTFILKCCETLALIIVSVPNGKMIFESTYQFPCKVLDVWEPKERLTVHNRVFIEAGREFGNKIMTKIPSPSTS